MYSANTLWTLATKLLRGYGHQNPRRIDAYGSKISIALQTACFIQGWDGLIWECPNANCEHHE